MFIRFGLKLLLNVFSANKIQYKQHLYQTEDNMWLNLYEMDGRRRALL
jgi:hypothetical protein